MTTERDKALIRPWLLGWTMQVLYSPTTPHAMVLTGVAFGLTAARADPALAAKILETIFVDDDGPLTATFSVEQELAALHEALNDPTT